jgi:hypothetical protein
MTEMLTIANAEPFTFASGKGRLGYGLICPTAGDLIRRLADYPDEAPITLGGEPVVVEQVSFGPGEPDGPTAKRRTIAELVEQIKRDTAELLANCETAGSRGEWKARA